MVGSDLGVVKRSRGMAPRHPVPVPPPAVVPVDVPVVVVAPVARVAPRITPVVEEDKVC